MDTGSGHIYDLDKQEIKGIKGSLVEWSVGEEVIVKGCKFKVKEIKVFPEDTIVLVGQPNALNVLKESFDTFAEQIPKVTEEESYHKQLGDFLKNK